MSNWNEEQLTTIGNADELEISSQSSDGTFTKYIPIWVVRVGDNIYVRSVHGTTSGWYSATQVQHQGQIKVPNLEAPVTFVNVSMDDTDHDQIDTVYQTKYSGYPKIWVDPTFTPVARGATLKLIPR